MGACNVTITATATSVVYNGACDGSEGVTITYTVTDNCNGSYDDLVCTQPVNAAPTPVTPDCPTLAAVDCEVAQGLTVADYPNIVSSNGLMGACNVTITAMATDVDVSGIACDGTGNVIVTYTVTDNCNGSYDDLVCTQPVNAAPTPATPDCPSFSPITYQVAYSQGLNDYPSIVSSNGLNGACNVSITATASEVILIGSACDASGYIQITYSVTDNCGGVYDDMVCNQPIIQPSPLTCSIDQLACNSNQLRNATSIVSGGTMPYDYLWSNGETTADLFNLPAGMYQLTVTDANNCQTNCEIIIDPCVVCDTICDTGFGRLEGSETCFIEYGFNRWGWTNGPIAEGTYTMNLYSGAAHCNTTNGYLAGTITVIYSENTVTVTYDLLPGYFMTETHLYVGCDMFPSKKGKPTVAPGQYPYQHQLNNQTTDSYTIDVSDFNCSEIYIVAHAVTCQEVCTPVSSCASLTSDIIQNGLSCDGLDDETATAIPSGGDSPFTYEWSDGQTTATATELGAGNVSVMIIDANGCTSTSHLSIVDAGGLTCSINQSPCNSNGLRSAIAMVNGGTAPFTYAWSNGAVTSTLVDLTEGSYQLTVTDNLGCMTECSIYIDNCQSAGCTNFVIDFNDFESGWGIWNDGGSDCRKISTSFSYSGNKCVRLRDNSSSSLMTTDVMDDFDNSASITIDFTYIANSMDNVYEDFWLQVSSDGGASFSTIEEWNLGDEFINGVREFESVTINGPFTDEMVFRFRCDASTNNDQVYIDDVMISVCEHQTFEGVVESEIEQKSPLNEVKIKKYLTDTDVLGLKVSPNPFVDWINVEIFIPEGSKDLQMNLYDSFGKQIESKQFDVSNQKILSEMILLENITSSFYILQVTTEKSSVSTRLIHNRN